MIAGKRVIAVIPARGGSKSIPLKNIVPLGGKPLIWWSIDVARRTGTIDRVIVSTDDDRIAEVARMNGAEVFKRPEHLATDQALVIDALRDLIETLRREGESAEIMVLLEPTCPLRAPSDVQGCIEMIADGAESAATFKKAELNPWRAWAIDQGKPRVFVDGANPWLPRQQLPKAYQLNGAVYAFKIDGLTETRTSLLFGDSRAVIMPPERSVDIDSILDIHVAESILRQGSHGAAS